MNNIEKGDGDNMSKHTDLGQYTEEALKRYFTLIPKDPGEDAHRAKRGMAFDTKAWEIYGIGHLCVMRMKAFLGLMKMETIVIAPFERDLPLFNADWVIYKKQLSAGNNIKSAETKKTCAFYHFSL